MNKGKFVGLLGSAEIKVKGGFPEKFINLALANGIRIWDTEITSAELVFKTDINSVAKLDEISDWTGCILEVQRKSGLLVIAGLLVRRKVLLAGFFCFCIALYLLAGLIWTLEIQGLEKLNKGEILQFVEPMGVYRWAKIRELDLHTIEQQLYVNFPEIAWVAVERSGTRVLIRIVEKENDPSQFGEPIDIVAQYDGIISEMMVLQGISMVEPGMTVARGDILISGFRDDGGLVNAAGSVMAIVYFEGYGESALEEIERVASGEEKLVQILQIGKINISLSRKHDFINFEVVESMRFFRGDPSFPLRILQRRYREILLTTHKYSPEQAEELARERAMLMAHQQVGEHADILRIEVKDISLDNNIYRYKVLLTVEAKIGQEQIRVRGEEPGE